MKASDIDIAYLDNLLIDGIRQLELELPNASRAKLIDYLLLFVKWNQAYNLSAVRDAELVLKKHLLDSLSVARYLKGQRFIDVGTGGGLPGIPLAITFPQYEFTLLDSNGKKMRFLHQVKQSLALSNVTLHDGRSEQFLPEKKYDGVISRAFASLYDMVDVSAHLLEAEGAFWAMKGQFPEDELRDLQKHYIVEACYPLEVPGLNGERHLVVVRKLSEMQKANNFNSL